VVYNKIKGRYRTMMDLQTISRLSREQARKAARLHKKPYLFEEEDRGHFPPFPFPNIGSYKPKGWELCETYFCDKFGIGGDGLAMSSEDLIKTLKAGYGYAIIEEGEFQLVVGEFKQVEKPKRRTQKEINPTNDIPY
jgi:hypothetical protein